MKNAVVAVLIISLFIIPYGYAETDDRVEATIPVPAESGPPSVYDDITWEEVLDENTDEDVDVSFHGYSVRSRRIESRTGDDITLVETATLFEEGERDIAPVGIVAIETEKSQ